MHATPSPQPATPNIDLLVIGEALIDLIPSKQGYMPSIGGSPLNVAVAAARLGVKTGFACGLSTDTHGEAIREYLQCNQVDTSLCPIVDKPTPLVMVTQGQDGEQYRFYLADTAERHGDQSALWQIDPPQYVHFGSYAAFLEPTQTGIVELLHHWKRHHDVIVSFDPNVRPLILPSAEDARAHCHHLLGLVDVIRLSEQDATWLYPERSSEQTAMAWHQHTHKPVVLTKGQQGATLYDKAGQYEQAALAVEVVDTIAAGDSFAGAILACLAQENRHAADPPSLANAERHPPTLTPRMIDFAIRAAGTTCTRVGANPPTTQEVLPSAWLPPQSLPPFERARWMMERLRHPQLGCPWDVEQTHTTILPYTLEEAREVADAITNEDDANLCEELGDLLLQVLFHSKIAEERGAFVLDDVVTGLVDKMVRRHPHVFVPGGKGTTTPVEQVHAAWLADKANRIDSSNNALAGQAGGTGGTGQAMGTGQAEDTGEAGEMPSFVVP